MGLSPARAQLQDALAPLGEARKPIIEIKGIWEPRRDATISPRCALRGHGGLDCNAAVVCGVHKRMRCRRIGHCLVAFALVSATQTLSGAGAPCGTPLSSYKGIPVYSNGDQQGTPQSCTEEESVYGRRFDSLEFATRFFAEAQGVPPGEWKSDPQDYVGTASDSGFLSYRNGGGTPPAPDDLIVFEELPGQPGLPHLGIASRASGGLLDVIEQNGASEGTVSLAVVSADGHYRVSPAGTADTGYKVIGWLRKPSTGPVITTSPKRRRLSGNGNAQAVVTFDDVASGTGVPFSSAGVGFSSDGPLSAEGPVVSSMAIGNLHSFWFPSAGSPPNFLDTHIGFRASFSADVNEVGFDFTCFGCDKQKLDSSMEWVLYSASGEVIATGSRTYDFSNWHYQTVPFLGVASTTPFRSIVIRRKSVSSNGGGNWFLDNLTYR